MPFDIAVVFRPERLPDDCDMRQQNAGGGDMSRIFSRLASSTVQTIAIWSMSDGSIDILPLELLHWSPSHAV